MSNYKIKVTQTKDLINAKMVTMQINRKDKDMIKISEIKKLTKKLIEENDGSKIRIRGLGISHMATVGEAVYSTLKGLDDDLNVKDIEEYKKYEADKPQTKINFLLGFIIPETHNLKVIVSNCCSSIAVAQYIYIYSKNRGINRGRYEYLKVF